MGPTWSSDRDSGTTPAVLMRQKMGDEAFAALLEKNRTKLGVSTCYPLGPMKLQDEMAALEARPGALRQDSLLVHAQQLCRVRSERFLDQRLVAQHLDDLSLAAARPHRL